MSITLAAMLMPAMPKLGANGSAELGSKLIDGGNPFNNDGQAVYKGGQMAVEDRPATGYSIIDANDMEEATELAKGCPLCATDGGVVCVYEALPM